MIALPQLFHHKWALPILAEFHAAGGGRFVALCRTLGASQGSIRQALEVMIEAEWIYRDQQYGHPLRPEYLLTENARQLATACAEVQAAMSLTELDALAESKWAAALVLVAQNGPVRFSDFRAALPEATDRALSQALKLAVSNRALVRTVDAEAHPPTPWYALSDGGQIVSKALQLLETTLTFA